MNPDEAMRAASDAIDAWCAVNPVPAGQFAMPESLPFTPPTEPVTVTYTRAVGPRERVQARLMLEGCTHDFQPRAGHYPEIVCGHCGVIVDEHGARFEDDEATDG